MPSFVDLVNDASRHHAEDHPAANSEMSGDRPAFQGEAPPFKNLLYVDSPGVSKDTPTTLATSRPTYSYGAASLTPAARTGPPRSLSFSYSPLPASLSSRSYFTHNSGDILEEPRRRPRSSTDNGTCDDPSSTYDLTPRETQFRGPFDGVHLGQKDREREAGDRRGKRKDWGKEKERNDAPQSGGPSSRRVSSAVASGSGSSPGLARSMSMSPQDKGKEPERRDSQSQPPGSRSPSIGWNRLRSLFPRATQSLAREPPPSAVTSGGVNIADELIVGGLSALILSLWFERDEHGRRRVPILLHRLRIRISDSLHPLHGAHSVFRIECEYANGAMRWVVYRQLRDFLSLHAHLAVSKAYSRNIEKLPEFPRTSRFLVPSSFARGLRRSQVFLISSS
jgi:phospholipase D1/2